ncbi:hypothetical protein D3C80_1938880 [compost metagenome]
MTPADDGVGILRKVECRSQHAAVHFKAGGLLVGEADPHRPEGIVRQHLQRAQDDADRHLDGLAPGFGVRHIDIHVQQGDVACIVKSQFHPGAVQSHIVNASLHRGPQR